MAKIEKFEELIKDYIGQNKTVENYKITNLLAPGENYLSEMVKIDVVLRSSDSGAKEDLHLVAKLVTNDPMMISTAIFTKNEIAVYKGIIPAVKRFHEKHGLPYPNFYPEFVGGRINLTGEEDGDENSIVVLENLKEKGYNTIDRHVGFDLQTAKVVLKDLATFHAGPLAMKLLEPEIFEAEIKENCCKFPPRKESPDGVPFQPKIPASFRIFLEIFEDDKKYANLVEKYKKFKEHSETLIKDDLGKFFTRDPVEPYATLIHSDMWINNTMQQVKDGKTLKNKIVDFQSCKFGSPIQDLLFLLFSSVELSCLKEHLDTLLNHYYETFADVLKKTGCYGPQFSKEKFEQELKLNGECAIGQCFWMMASVIFAEKGKAVDRENADKLKKEDLPPLAIEKLIYLCSEATKRDWY